MDEKLLMEYKDILSPILQNLFEQMWSKAYNQGCMDMATKIIKGYGNLECCIQTITDLEGIGCCCDCVECMKQHDFAKEWNIHGEENT